MPTPDAPARSATSRPHTILFAPASNVLFHVGRSLTLARELRRRGHRVAFIGSPRYLRDPDIAAGEEFEFHPAPDFGADEAMEILRTIHKVPSRRLIDRMIAAELDVLERVRPDLIVSDFRPTIFIAGRARGIPLASMLLSHWMQPYSSSPPRAIRSHAITELAARLLGDDLAGRLTPPIWRAVLRYKSRPFRAAERAHGQVPRRLVFDTMDGDLNLLTDSEAWSPTRPLPPHFHRVGPIAWEPDLPLPPALADLDPERPVVYVTFGSTGHPALFRTIFACFADTPLQVVVSTGGQIDPRDFDVPSNFIVERFLPNGKVMQIADLVIYHGGSGTAYHTVRGAVPAIVVATHWDQEYAGLVTQEQGLGLGLTMREILRSPRRLLDAVEQVLANLPAHRDRVERLRKDLFKYDGPAAAAGHLEAFLRSRKA